MSSIDERIVQMHFDNKEFERNIKTSMDSLSNLKKSLDFKGCEKGLDTIAKSADKVDMGVMINALDTASNKFDAMRVVAITSLSRITNAVIDAGVNFVKSLSIDNVNVSTNLSGKSILVTIAFIKHLNFTDCI